MLVCNLRKPRACHCMATAITIRQKASPLIYGSETSVFSQYTLPDNIYQRQSKQAVKMSSSRFLNVAWNFLGLFRIHTPSLCSYSIYVLFDLYVYTKLTFFHEATAVYNTVQHTFSVIKHSNKPCNQMPFTSNRSILMHT